MIDSNKKIKIYVIGTILIILIISRFIFLGIHNNYHFTPNYFVRTLKSIQIKNEFDSFLKKNNAPLVDIQDQVNLEYVHSIPVIVYHGIPYVDSDASGQFNITEESFKEQMFALKKAGYTTITTQELYKYLKKEIELSPKSILITFDDGRIDSFELADPVLKALDYKATMFIIGRYSILGERNKYYLSINQLKEMDRSGHWDIQAHSYDGHESYFTNQNIQDGHFFSHKQWRASENSLETDQDFRERISNDFKKVKEGIEKILDKPVESFAFPYGDFGQNNTNFQYAQNINTEEAQKFFSMIFYQNSPIQRFRNNYLIEKQSPNNFFLIKRIIVNSNWTGSDFLRELHKSTAKDLPYIDNFTQDNGWLLLWGKLSIKENFLDLHTEQGQTGATIILDGSRLWKDYSVKASVVAPNKTAVYVWVRFQDDNNNAACDFSNGFIHIEQSINGQKNIIRGIVDEKIQIPNTEFKIEAKVKDREIECILNNTLSVKSSFLDQKIDTGGIGFKAWNEYPDTAKVLIKNLTVEKYENNQQ